MCNKQKDCGCGTKGGIKPTLKYCGAELPCTGIVKGDDYTTVLQKIDAIACNGGGDGGNYTFAESSTCPNGGLIVRKNGVQVFEQCYECCDEGGTPFYFYAEGRSSLEFGNPPTIGDGVNPNVYGATQIAFTIPPGQGGIYEIIFNADWFSGANDDGKIFTYVNNTALGVGGTNCTHLKRGSASGFDEMQFQIPVTHFQSDINLQAGDIIGICTEGGTMTPEPKPSVQHYRVKITKIG